LCVRCSPITGSLRFLQQESGGNGARVVWLVAFCFAATAAQADIYPNKPIRMIVPFPAGSATDGQARLIGAHFQKVFGQGFIVENMAGATGSIAARTVAKAPPDGYTLLLSSVSTHSAKRLSL
jgi:tripartite-type tricarboxylate transporter receptor subunit TctC